MKAIFTTFFLFCICATAAFSQPKIYLGPELENDKRFQTPQCLGKIDGSLYVLRYEANMFSRHFLLERYNSKFEITKKEELIVNPAKEDQEFEAVKLWNGVLYFFTSYINEKTEKHTLYVSEIDPKTLLPKTKRRVIMEYPIIKHNRTYPFEFFDSNNGMLHMIYGNVPVPKGEDSKFQVMVLTPSLDKMWEKQFKVPVADKLFDISTREIDNAGNFYISGRVFNEKAKEKRYGEPNYEYVIYVWRNEGNDRKEYHVSFPDKFITDFVFGINLSGDIVGGGFYSDKGTSSIKGTFFLSVDAETQQVTGKGIKQFDVNFLELFMSENRAAKGKELYEYDLNNLVFTDDGGVHLIAEQYYVVVTSYTTGNGQVRQTYHYYYNDIIIVDFNSAGKVEWVTKIPKFQHTVNDGGYFSSFFLGTHDDKFYLIYNDHPENLNVKEKGKLKNYLGKESVTVMVTVDPDGEWKKSILFDNKEEEIYSRPKVMNQFEANGEIVIYGEKRKTFRFGALRFN